MAAIAYHPSKIDGHRQRAEGIERGMVLMVSVPPAHARGGEQNHAASWPWLIVSNNRLHQRQEIAIAVPLTSQLHQADKLPKCRIVIRAEKIIIPAGSNGIARADSLVLTEQIRAISHDRVKGQPVARIAQAGMDDVDAAVLYVLDIKG